MLSLELGDQAAKTQDLADRDGVNPNGGLSGEGPRQLYPQPFTEIEPLFSPELHPEGIDRSINGQEQNEDKRI